MPQPASMPRPAVHPHERGEYLFQEPDRFLDVGSSPRTWGILPQIPAIDVQKRFIPTNVGNTRAYDSALTQLAVHPHERGEYIQILPERTSGVGSSPRTWGIRIRIHPQRALETVHPHERGEYSSRGQTPTSPGGSSPRTWGIRRRRMLHDRLHAVHPHERGEYFPIASYAGDLFGSSPRTWGIPLPRGRAPPICPVHPHERGEYDDEDFLKAVSDGSSPRTWGIRV